MSTATPETAATEINRLHADAKQCAADSRQSLNGALTAAWQAGHLLIAEKKRVRRSMGPSAWLLWLEANFRGSARTARRYMQLARSVSDVTFLQGMSLRQAYVRLGIATESKRPGRRLLAHRLPQHVSLANRLIRTLRFRPATGTMDENLRRDLRPLYDLLRPWFGEECSSGQNLHRPFALSLRDPREQATG